MGTPSELRYDIGYRIRSRKPRCSPHSMWHRNYNPIRPSNSSYPDHRGYAHSSHPIRSLRSNPRRDSSYNRRDIPRGNSRRRIPRPLVRNNNSGCCRIGIPPHRQDTQLRRQPAPDSYIGAAAFACLRRSCHCTRSNRPRRSSHHLEFHKWNRTNHPSKCTRRLRSKLHCHCTGLPAPPIRYSRNPERDHRNLRCRGCRQYNP